ncbi:hypothetical protein LCGC14_0831460 [marine sediment metagenome]|uniref:Uncharacterized protein n=1 Tax=marine sediment metagenome TaxID=412755 RepID=A0A0F9Q111_9ZZZZ|nr:hypothetical protein [bacterium]
MENAVIIILLIALLGSLGLCGFIVFYLTNKHQEEKRDLHNRLMSREYPEYLQGEHTQQAMRAEEEKNKNKPKEHEKLDKDFVAHKKKAEQF